MEKIPLDTLIQNAREGKVTREIYVRRILEEMLYLPLLVFIRWKRDVENPWKEYDCFDCIDKVLEIVGLSYNDDLCYLDIVREADILLRLASMKERKRIYEAAEPLILIFSSLYERFGW